MRVTSAARIVYRYPETAARLEDRQARAMSTLAAMLGSEAAVTVPGFRIARTPDGIAVEAQAPTHADQLALWTKEAA